jgi:hypothetical protein
MSNLNPLSVARDSSGNIYYAAFNGGTFTSVIAKFNSQGQVQWQKNLSSSLGSGSNYVIVARDPQVSASGSHIYLSGYHNTVSTGFEGYVIKIATDTGTITWQKSLGSGSTTVNAWTDNLSRIILDSQDNVYVAAASETTTTTNHCWINKLDSSGNLVWKKLITNNLGLRNGLEDLAWDSSQSYLYAVGYFGSALSGQQNGVIFKIDPTTGSVAQAWATPGTHHTSIAIDTDGSMIVGGYVSNNGDYSSLILKLDSSGTNQWSRIQIDGGAGNARSVWLDSSSNIYAAMPTSYYHTYFQLSPSGTTQWVRAIKVSGNTRGISGSEGFMVKNGVLQYTGRPYASINNVFYYMNLIGLKTPTASTGTFTMTLGSVAFDFAYVEPTLTVLSTLTSTTTFTTSVLSAYTVSDPVGYTISTGPGVLGTTVNYSSVTVI